MVRLVYGKEGDEHIIVMSDGQYYLEEYYCGGYYCAYASKDFGKVLKELDARNAKTVKMVEV